MTCLQEPKKERQSQKIARTAPKNVLNNSRALPNKTRVLRQTAPESSPESSAKSLSRKFLGVPFLSLNVRTSDFQSEVGEVFGEIGGELPAKFGSRFSSFFCWSKLSEAFSTKTPPQISPSNFTTRFWVVAGPMNVCRHGVHALFAAVALVSSEVVMRLHE